MGLIHPTQLHERILRLLTDILPVRSVGAIGYQPNSAKPALVDSNIRALREERSWTFVDLRHTSSKKAESALGTLGAGPFVVAVHASQVIPRTLLEQLRVTLEPFTDERKTSWA